MHVTIQLNYAIFRMKDCHFFISFSKSSRKVATKIKQVENFRYFSRKGKNSVANATVVVTISSPAPPMTNASPMAVEVTLH